MDLSKLGLKPFKKEPINEPVLDTPAGTPDVGGADPSPVPADAVPAGAVSEAGTSRPVSPLAALLAKKAVVDGPKAEVQTSQEAPEKSPEAPQIEAPKNALALLLSKQPKAPAPATPAGGILPSPLDVDLVETIPVGPEGFQYHLDRLDALIQRDGGITALTQDTIKGKIKDLFTELNQFPEYDGLIIDRDVSNIMKFMQHSLSATKLVVEKKVATRTAKANAKEKPKFTFDLGGMEDMLLAGAQASIPASVDALGTLDVDAIDAKFNRTFKK